MSRISTLSYDLWTVAVLATYVIMMIPTGIKHYPTAIDAEHHMPGWFSDHYWTDHFFVFLIAMGFILVWRLARPSK